MKTTGILVKNGRRSFDKQIPIEEAKDIYKNNPLEFYSDLFFGKMNRVRKWQKPLGLKFAEILDINSVVDFGCASGFYIEGMKEKCSRILGFEYAYENAKKYIPEEIKEYISYGDVQKPIDLKGEKFDLALSIEVAEHILPENSDQFVDNLVNASQKYIYMSAATPGQGGSGHINEQPLDYWKEKVEAKGFSYDKAKTQALRSAANQVPFRVHPYMKKNTMLFVG